VATARHGQLKLAEPARLGADVSSIDTHSDSRRRSFRRCWGVVVVVPDGEGNAWLAGDLIGAMAAAGQWQGAAARQIGAAARGLQVAAACRAPAAGPCTH
jgi:hypothetical protein